MQLFFPQDLNINHLQKEGRQFEVFLQSNQFNSTALQKAWAGGWVVFLLTQAKGGV